MININHQKGYFLIFITVFFIMNSGCIYKGTNEENDASNKGTTIQITNFNSTKYWPDIFDDKIVWADNRNNNFDIYFYNITTSSESRITTNESDQIYPMIWGDYIIWLDFRFDLNGKLDTMYSDAVGYEDYGEVFIYKISSGQETRLSNNGTLNKPIINGNYVFWNSGGGNLTRYNLNTAEFKVISFNTSYIKNFDVSGNYIVWEDNRYYHDAGPSNQANKNIFLLDQRDFKEIRITYSNGQQFYPKISGSKICYFDSDVDNSMILTDYDTKENRTISYPDSEIAYSFDISENYVIGLVNNDSFDFEQDIFIYDISKDDLRILDQPVGMKGFISIYENKFIWIDYRDCQNIPLECVTMADNVNIYYYEI